MSDGNGLIQTARNMVSKRRSKKADIVTGSSNSAREQIATVSDLWQGPFLFISLALLIVFEFLSNIIYWFFLGQVAFYPHHAAGRIVIV